MPPEIGSCTRVSINTTLLVYSCGRPKKWFGSFAAVYTVILPIGSLCAFNEATMDAAVRVGAAIANDGTPTKATVVNKPAKRRFTHNHLIQDLCFFSTSHNARMVSSHRCFCSSGLRLKSKKNTSSMDLTHSRNSRSS